MTTRNPLDRIDPEVALIHAGRADCQPFVASIEPCNGPTFQHGYHLGTNETIAREFVREIFTRHTQAGTGLYTVALLRNGHIVDVWDGRDWLNDTLDADDAERWVEAERDHATAATYAPKTAILRNYLTEHDLPINELQGMLTFEEYPDPEVTPEMKRAVAKLILNRGEK